MASINKVTFQCSGCIITAAVVRQFFSENPNFLGQRKEKDIEIATSNIMSILIISGKKLDLGAYFALCEQGILMNEIANKDAERNWDDLFIPHVIERDGKQVNRFASRHSRNPKKQRLVA
ncbi:hypothetical protein H6769_04730 [Candidatus Peribacteria bacterium]|nr:hypothetical protein [Candidatus Peribacteria bacterium]